jgi:hypothetical protein
MTLEQTGLLLASKLPATFSISFTVAGACGKLMAQKARGAGMRAKVVAGGIAGDEPKGRRRLAQPELTGDLVWLRLALAKAPARAATRNRR